MAELSETTRKMTKYFKGSCKHSNSHPSDNNSHHINTNHYSTPYSDKHKFKSCKNNDKVSEVIHSTCNLIAYHQNPKHSKELNDSDSFHSSLNSSLDSELLAQTDDIIKVKLRNTKYATNFPVTINKNLTISLFDTDATISCMSKHVLTNWIPNQH